MKSLSVLLVLVAVSLAGCASRANVDYDQAFNFEQIATYAWLDLPTAGTDPTQFYLSQLSHQRMVYAIDNQLMSKNLTKVSRHKADVLVSYQAMIIKQELPQLQPQLEYSLGFSHHYHRNYFGLSYQLEPAYRRYDERSLVIDILSPNQQLIWRGGLSLPIKTRLTPVERAKEINQTVAKILISFPPTLTSETDK